MLLMFQNKGIDMAHYYYGKCDPTMIHAGMFLKDCKPSSAYYGFMAYGQMYRLRNQVEIKIKNNPEDLYAVAASGEKGHALLISNVSEDKNYPLNIEAEDYTPCKCMTVSKSCKWVEVKIPSEIESGEILYIAFKRSN